MQSTGWSKDLRVTADGTGVVSHVGAALLRMLTDLAVMIADGGEAIADIDVLRCRPSPCARALPGSEYYDGSAPSRTGRRSTRPARRPRWIRGSRQTGCFATVIPAPMESSACRAVPVMFHLGLGEDYRSGQGTRLVGPVSMLV